MTCGLCHQLSSSYLALNSPKLALAEEIQSTTASHFHFWSDWRSCLLRVRGLEESHGRANEGVWPAASPANNKARSVWSYVATGESTGKIKSQLRRNINNQLIPTLLDNTSYYPSYQTMNSLIKPCCFDWTLFD